MVDSKINSPVRRTKVPFVSVVLSFYNEQNVLPELLARLRKVLRGQRDSGLISDYELIFVNDASTDGSLVILHKEHEAENDIVIVDMSRNFGCSECVFAGMKYSKGDVVFYMDADLQDPPEIMPQMIQKWMEDSAVEVVYTTRITRAGEHFLKLLITKWGYRMINYISEIDLPVDSGDYKLLSRRFVDDLLKLQEKKPYVRGLISWVGYKQVQVLYHREERFDGRVNTKFPVLSRRVIAGYLDRALISFSSVPLKMSLILGFAVSFCAILYLAVVFYQKIAGLYVPGWPALMAAILFLGGVQLTMLGVFGLYLNTIYLESKRRPNFIVKSVLSKDDRAF